MYKSVLKKIHPSTENFVTNLTSESFVMNQFVHLRFKRLTTHVTIVLFTIVNVTFSIIYLLNNCNSEALITCIMLLTYLIINFFTVWHIATNAFTAV